MKTLIAASLTVCASLPLTAQPTTTQQLVAARDTVWRAWFANDTALLRRFIPQSAAAAEGGATLTWSDRGAILAGSQRIASSGAKLEKLDSFGTQVDASGNSAIV